MTGRDTRPAATNPTFADVSLLLSMNGSNGSTTFTDSSSNAFTVSATGNAQVSTAQSKFGGASGAFDGTGDYLAIAADAAFAFGTGDFTVEAWVYVSNYLNNNLNVFATAGVSSDFSCYLTHTGELAFWNGSASTVFGGSASTGTWHHVAFSRDSGSMRAFLNGWQVGSTTTINTNLTNTQEVQFPATEDYSSPDCYIDELRVTKGAAIYTANFQPPTSPFPTS